MDKQYEIKVLTELVKAIKAHTTKYHMCTLWQLPDYKVKYQIINKLRDFGYNHVKGFHAPFEAAPGDMNAYAWEYNGCFDTKAYNKAKISHINLYIQFLKGNYTPT